MEINESLEIEMPRRYVPKPCGFCATRREPGTNYSYVYCVTPTLRYCKCGKCGETWKEMRRDYYDGSI